MRDETFADIAVALRCASSALCLDMQGTEALAAKLNSPGVDRALKELQTTVKRVDAAANLIRDLIEHEPEVRKLSKRKKPRLVYRARKIAGLL